MILLSLWSDLFELKAFRAFSFFTNLEYPGCEGLTQTLFSVPYESELHRFSFHGQEFF